MSSPNDLVVDAQSHPMFIGSPAQTKQWLQERDEQGRSLNHYKVRVGSTMKHVTVAAYLSGRYQK
jgi:hypothetical protein